MENRGPCSNSTSTEILTSPAYPFNAGALLRDLRTQLSQQLGLPMTVDVLARLAGRPRSTIHRWFEVHAPPHLVAYMCLLERLSPSCRRAFIDRYCRPCPSLDDPRLAHSPATIRRLRQLVEKPTGLVIAAGGTEASRKFVTAALGHACRAQAAKHPPVTGIDLHRPVDFVPVKGIHYIDGMTGSTGIRKIVAEIMPKILTSNARLLLFHGIWPVASDWHKDILRCARYKNVVLMESELPSVADVKKCVSTRMHFLALSASKQMPDGIRITFRCT